MQIEIFENAQPIGSLQIDQEGLYRHVHAECRPLASGVLRLYVWQGTQGCCLGVLCPEKDAFTLTKRLSSAMLPFSPEIAVVGREDEGFLPWRGKFDGAFVEQGYLLHAEEGEVLAVPLKEDMEYPFAHQLSRTRQQTVNGVQCLVLLPCTEAEEPPSEQEFLEVPERPSQPQSAEQTPPADTEPPTQQPEESQTRFHTEA